MSTGADVAALGGLGPGDHVCWIVDDPAGYPALAAAILADGARLNQKCVVFGPVDSPDYLELSETATMAADPRTAFLGGGPLDAATMLAMFAKQSADARTEGYDGLRVVADMNWLLPAQPTTSNLVGFELELDRAVKEIGATVVCAYRRDSFEMPALSANWCVHPKRLGCDAPPQFGLLAATDAGTWQLWGEVDISVAATFETVFEATAALGDYVIEFADSTFIDVAGLRTIARAASAAKAAITIRNSSSTFRRCWQLAGFDSLAPLVTIGA